MIGNNIRRIRITKGMTQLDLAIALGISDKTISSWESGRTEPKMGMIERICIILNCKKSEITGRDESTIDDEYFNKIIGYLKNLDEQQRIMVEAMLKGLSEQEGK